MLLHLKFIRDVWKLNVRPVQVLSCVFPACMSVKMLLVVHPLCNRVVVSIWFYVSQFMFVKVYISVKVQLKCITVNISYLSFHISFIGHIHIYSFHCTLLVFALWLD